MLNEEQLGKLKAKVRSVQPAKEGDVNLGPLKLLPGTWSNKALPGRGWNMIAVPFSGGPVGYRLLLNQFDETLKFSFVDDRVANRGITVTGAEDDQFVVALDYEQKIDQIAVADFPESGLAGEPGATIHHEPGLWLHMTNKTTDNLDIARLATIPHGDSVLALGTSDTSSQTPQIDSVNGLPIGVSHNLDGPYLAPYKHFNDNPFKGVVDAPGFPGFNPVDPSALLKLANEGVNIVRTTKLEVDTTMQEAGIVNIPFIVKQANASDMKSTFWIQEIEETDANGKLKTTLRLQYLQVVMLDFFPRKDGAAGLIRWPHISINTLEKDNNDSQKYAS